MHDRLKRGLRLTLEQFTQEFVGSPEFRERMIQSRKSNRVDLAKATPRTQLQQCSWLRASGPPLCMRSANTAVYSLASLVDVRLQAPIKVAKQGSKGLNQREGHRARLRPQNGHSSRR